MYVCMYTYMGYGYRESRKLSHVSPWIRPAAGASSFLSTGKYCVHKADVLTGAFAWLSAAGIWELTDTVLGRLETFNGTFPGRAGSSSFIWSAQLLPTTSRKISTFASWQLAQPKLRNMSDPKEILGVHVHRHAHIASSISSLRMPQG